MFTQNKLTTCNRNAGTAECKSERFYHGEDENVQAPQIDRQTQHHRTSWKCYANRNLRSSFLSFNCLSVDHSLPRSFPIFSPATKYVVCITRKEKRRWSKFDNQLGRWDTHNSQSCNKEQALVGGFFHVSILWVSLQGMHLAKSTLPASCLPLQAGNIAKMFEITRGTLQKALATKLVS